MKQRGNYILTMIGDQRELTESRKLCEALFGLTRKRTEKMLVDARKVSESEAEEVKKSAYAEGFDKGYRDGKEKARAEGELLKGEQKALMAEHQALFLELYEAYRKKKEEKMEELSSQIIEIIMAAAEKITREKIDDDPSIILRSVRDSAKILAHGDRITIRLNPHEYNQLGKEYFINSIHLPDVHIIEDPAVEVHGFILESEYGMLDGQVSTQLASIKEVFSADGSGEEAHDAPAL
jgi:flagellar assembly protein FliH